MWDSLWTNAVVATMKPGRPYGLIEQGAVGIASGRIAWVGPVAALPAPPTALAHEVTDVVGKLLTPGLVDCHTHLVHAGNRRRDFELRVSAAREDYERGAGGILQTMRQTRAAGEAPLLAASAARLSELIAAGVTTVESKSGYGLDRETELKQLRVSRALGRRMPVTLVTSFLGAHSLPPEYAGRPDDYIDFLAGDVLPTAVQQGLADAVDGFCDRGGFTAAQTARLYDAATALGLPVKCHADQYSDAGAAALVARFRGLSADHLEHAGDASLAAMAEAGTVAVLLPGANYTLMETKRPPVQRLRSLGVPIALATNCNPGSSPTTLPTMTMSLACHLFRLTPEEALAGFTRIGAQALRLEGERGTLAVGKAADMVLWDVEHPAELPYRIAANPCRAVVKDGAVVHRATPPDLLRPNGVA